MPHYLLSAEARFSAAHTLPGVAACDRMHGHNWRVRITIRLDAGALDRRRMGLDFRDLQAVTGQCVEDFEHRYLNDLEPFREEPPTAEMLARVVAERATTRLERLAPAARVEEVEVWEVPEYRVVYHPH